MILNSNLFLIYKLKCIGSRFIWSTKSIIAFCELFDLSRTEFNTYRKEANIPPLAAEHLEEISILRNKLNIPKKDWLAYSVLLTTPAMILEEKYTHLKEGGFEKVNANILANYGKFIRKTIRFLKMSEYLPKRVNVAESFLRHLSPKSAVCIDDLNDDCNFHFIHHAILTRYLMWKFKTSKDNIEKLYRRYSLSNIKSFRLLLENFKLADDIGFTCDNIFKYGPLLGRRPELTKMLIAKIPKIAGVEICSAIQKTPELLRVPAHNLLEIYENLKEANISDESIQRHMKIFCSNPNTVKLRLQEAKKIPEFDLFRNDPDFLKLIIHHNEARSRLSFLNKIKSKCVSLRTLCEQPTKFSSFIEEGADMQNRSEVKLFIQRLLKSDSEEISINLKKHSHYRHVELKSISESYEYLRKLGFGKEAIIAVVQVLLYPKDKLKIVYENACEYIQGDVNQIQKLNLMLYFMEREYHFTGNGIWNNTENA